MRIKQQMGIVFNLDKCLGCQTCTIACKNVWTNREGAEYMFWNNVETKPGAGYPKEWENQDKYRGGWKQDPEGDVPKLNQASRFWEMISLFYNPVLPQMGDYYGKGPFTFTYEDLHSEQPTKFSQPVARPKSQITGEEDIELTYGVNWEDNGAGTHEEGTGKLDYNFSDMSPAARQALLKFQDSFMMYLPRICNHCLNPACVGSCPSGANYKREEDGVVLIDQDRCRGWRYCVSGCPYKKTYYNWRTGKSEKCILCFPRLETGQPPMCFQACVGRIRYLGPLLYDLDRVAETANAPELELVARHREIILNPFDPEIIAEAKRQGISDNWLEACCRSPVYKMVKEWEIALPLHPEFRTLPSLFYIPPESPVATAKPNGRNTLDMVNGGTVLPDLKEFRIPIEYLARLLAAGNIQEVEKALLRQLALREFRRLERVEGTTDDSVLKKVGMTVEQARHMHRLLSLAHFHERFVIATARSEDTKNAPYLERGFTGYDLMSPGAGPKRRTEFHGNKMGVGELSMNRQSVTQKAAGSAGWDLSAAYRAIAELMLNPAVRETAGIQSALPALDGTPMGETVQRFLASPAAHNVDEYTATLELTPPCPLYLGAHMYDEPTSCRGAGACGRNQYMIELGAVYEHFGFRLAGELPDFVPVMVEFLAVSSEHPERDGIGLRRRFVETYLEPGLPHLRKALQKYESVYDLLIEALECAVNEDLERLADDPVWLDPEVKRTIPVRIGSSVPNEISMRG